MSQKTSVIEFHPDSSAWINILLVDDFAPWRAQVRSFLQSKAEWKIVSEACDGLEAIEKTVELHPDIVLIDIQMPGMNGIEATKRIRRLSPDSKIIIFTQYKDEDLQAAALQAGASAYVLKIDNEYLPYPRCSGSSAGSALGSLAIHCCYP